MSDLSIGDRSIGEDEPTYFIAEAGINHNGSLQIAKELVDIAEDAGADAVKFQKRKLEKTYQEEIVDNPSIGEMGLEYTVSNLKDVMLSDREFAELADYTAEKDIHFLCSPWDVDSVGFLEDIDIPAYKIGSPDMTNFVLLERVIETDKPLLISTGMSEEEEIDRTVQFIEDRDVNYGLLHCRSTYPAPFKNLNLSFMSELLERYQVPVGYSGHERGIAVSEAAAAMGATVIERHFTLSRDMDGPDHAASLSPNGLRKSVRDIRAIEESMGTPHRHMTRGEYNNRMSLGKSLAATESIPADTEITRSMLTAKSPAKGISPQELYKVVGSKTAERIGYDQLLQWEDLQIDDETLERFDVQLDNWGVVVRFSDIDKHDWGDPDVFEFRINGADVDEPFEVNGYEKELGIHAPEQKGHDLVDLSARTEDKRQEAVKIIQTLIDKVREQVAPKFLTEEPPIIIHPGGVTRDHMEPDAVPAMNEALARSMSELDDEGVTLLLENMPPFPWIYGGQQYHNNFMRAEEIAEYCERHDQKICYDTSHAKLWCNHADVDLVEHARTLRPYVEYLHVADAVGTDGEGVQIDEGEVEWANLMDVFADFDGPIITEIWRGHEKRGQGFKRAAKRLEQYRR
jgi:N-acetylneuraminate synthase